VKSLKNDSFTSSVLRNSVILLFWWCIFFPGFYSTDSFSAISQAKSGGLSSTGSATWSLYVRYVSLLGNAVPLLTLISGLILTYSVTCLAYSITSKRIAAISSFVLVATPVVYAMGITLWRDIPFTAGLLLVAAYFASRFSSSVAITQRFWFLLVPGSVLLTFRPNGLPTLALFSIVYFFFNRNRKTLKDLFSALILSTFMTIGFSYLFFQQAPLDSLFGQEFMRADISCFASLDKGIGFVEKNLPGISDTQGWSSREACTFISRNNLTVNDKIKAIDLLPPVWLKLIVEEPKFVLETHLRRHAYLVPVPLYGIPETPFIHSTIEFTDRGISWAFPEIAEVARVLPRAWNAGRALFGWAGFWFVVMILFARRRNKLELTPIIVMSFSLMSLLFVTAPIPDGRYALFVIISGQLILLNKCLERLSSTFSKSSFK
jgi:hypothetical protein